MGFSGLPRRKYAQQEKHGGRKSYLYYAERRKLHLERGPTLPEYASNTNISAASVRGKWSRFCSQACQDPDTLLKNLTAPDVKSWFDWIEENFSGSIKAHSALANYWRTLKRLYFIKNHQEMEPNMQTDCRNYMNVVSRRMGLRRHPLPKPTAASDDLLHFLVTHMAHCDSVFADEKQRLYVLAGLNLSSISACRAVSLFDTRHTVNLQPDGRPLETSGPKNPSNRTKCESSFKKSEDEAPSGGSSHTTGKDTEMSELEETDLDDIFSHHSDLETASDVDCDSDASSVTDDGYLEGDEETNTILWRHIEFYIVRNPTPGERHILAAIITLLHTKGEDRKPRIKRFVIEHEENLIFDLLGQLMALAIDDDIFVATMKDVADIYTVPIPAHRRGIQMKIKRDKLDIPIFREPEHTAEGYRTSDSQPLKSRTWSRNLKRLGIRAGQAQNLTQKVLRRGGINAINNQAPSSVRDQVADHESNAVKYYLNEVVDFDTAAAFHKRPSNEIVQRELRSATLLADHTAPIGLTDAQSRKISRDPEVRRLRRISRGLTARIRAMGLTIKDAAGTEAGEQKRRADAELNSMLTCLRDKAKERNRKRHFRDTDTAIFNQQYEGTSGAASGDGQSQLPRYYHISERAELVRLLCYSALAETTEDAHHRRLEYVRLLVRWQRRKESPRRGKQAAVSIQQMPTPTPPKAEIIPERYDPLQCPFCLSDLRLPQVDRQKRKCKTNKLWDHVEKIHCQELAAFDTGNRRCGICSIRNIDFLPSSRNEFKNHTQTVHGIRLRP
ncbi:uncharacterized protein AKAW2_30054A [Aspergillus luchuensis]|uniref:FluG domain protein n=2 Tax=Aspergillus kawachii TaxID=1069201 RepID=A0A7R7W5H9_ASPKA|nr:uncharacterized protein AKAW2_30054A [Aspergillus luchuensis]BCR96735.1 hypothetical protein AKAW2_30054A [Aspergillus luchuensis]GAA92894.1 hypothetical protein AKAW_11007 [Aspergillus luchuensis IFO 4308]